MSIVTEEIDENLDDEVEVEEKEPARPKFSLPKFKGKVYFIGNKEESLINIPFLKFYNFAQCYENFKLSLSSKRVYNRAIMDIIDDNNRVLNHSFTLTTIDVENDGVVKRAINKDGSVANEFILNYLSLKMNIDDGGDLSEVGYPVFISELMNLINDDMMKIIKHYTDSIYLGSMDEVIDMEKHAFEMSTTFVDNDIKQLCYVKYAGNLLIPLCTHYCNKRSRDVDSKEFFLDLYKSLFRKASQGSSIDTLSKLHKYISMIVNNAFKTHKQIYSKMCISGITKDSEIEEVFSKVLTTIITKLQPTDTIPAFIAESIKNSSSRFKPRKDNGFSVLQGFSDDYISSGNEDGVVTEAERMESRIARPDELLKLIRKISPDDTIHKISHRFGVFIEDDAELLFMIDNMRLHDYQTRIIFQMFSSMYGGYENMFDNNRHNYVRLLLLASKHLKNIGLEVISDYICGVNTVFSIHGRWSGKSGDRKLFEDPRYIEIINGKYRFSRAQFERRNFIRDDVVFLSNNMFKYNKYNDPRNGKVISKTDDEIIDAVLKYYQTII